MAEQRRYERDHNRDDDRTENRQDWSYGRGRQSWQGRGDDDHSHRSSFGRGSGASYGGGNIYGRGMGRGREGDFSEGMTGRDNRFGEHLGFEGNEGSPGALGERTARYGSRMASDIHGQGGSRGSPDDAWRSERRYGYGGERDWNQERGMMDRAADEVSSWFGDEDAERRREMDKHRGKGPKNYARSEERIREEVCDRLTDDNWVDASEIDVQVSGTEVTLSGTVSSRDQRRRAEMCVERVSGVTHVQNNVRVKERDMSGSSTAGNS